MRHVERVDYREAPKDLRTHSAICENSNYTEHGFHRAKSKGFFRCTERQQILNLQGYRSIFSGRMNISQNGEVSIWNKSLLSIGLSAISRTTLSISKYKHTLAKNSKEIKPPFSAPQLLLLPLESLILQLDLELLQLSQLCPRTRDTKLWPQFPVSFFGVRPYYPRPPLPPFPQ